MEALSQPPAPAELEQESLPKNVLGDRYRLVALIDRQGPCEWYRAENLTGADPVTVIVCRGLGTAMAREPRVNTLLRSIVGLSHPHLAKVIEHSWSSDELYLVTEELGGQTLGKLLSGAPLEPARIHAIGKQLLSALAYAHRRGVHYLGVDLHSVVVHRDAEGRDNVKLVDVGLRGLLRCAGQGGKVDGVVIAPEQGQGEHPNQRTDVYVAGMLLLQMVSRNRFLGSETKAGTATRPRLSELREDLEISRDFEALMQRATAEAPAERFRDGALFVAMFDRSTPPKVKLPTEKPPPEVPPPPSEAPSLRSGMPRLAPAGLLPAPAPAEPVRRPSETAAAGARTGAPVSDPKRTPGVTPDKSEGETAPPATTAAGPAKAPVTGPSMRSRGATSASPGKAPRALGKALRAPAPCSDRGPRPRDAGGERRPEHAAGRPEHAQPGRPEHARSGRPDSVIERAGPIRAPEPLSQRPGSDPTMRRRTHSVLVGLAIVAAWFAGRLSAPQSAEPGPPIAALAPQSAPSPAQTPAMALESQGQPGIGAATQEPPVEQGTDQPGMGAGTQESPVEQGADRGVDPGAPIEYENATDDALGELEGGQRADEPVIATTTSGSDDEGSATEASADGATQQAVSASPQSQQRPPARDPWASPLPAPLAEVNKLLEAGMDDVALRPATVWSREHPEDPRPWLLMARTFMLRHWRPDAIKRYRTAFVIDPTCRGDRRMLSDLVKLSGHPLVSEEAVAALKLIYGAEAIPALERAVSKAEDNSTREILTRVRAQF